MKKTILTIVTAALLSIPNVGLIAGSGDTAAGVAAGLGIGMLGIAASQSGRGSARRAEEEARRAQDQAAAVRREHQQEKMLQMQRQMERQHMTKQSGRTLNILIFAVVLLFLAVLGLGALLLKRKN